MGCPASPPLSLVDTINHILMVLMLSWALGLRLRFQSILAVSIGHVGAYNVNVANFYFWYLVF